MPRPAIDAAKLLTAQGLVLLGSAVVCLLIVLSGWALILWQPALAAAGPPPAGSILGRAFLCWLAAGLILSVHLWIAMRWPSFVVASGSFR